MQGSSINELSKRKKIGFITFAHLPWTVPSRITTIQFRQLRTSNLFRKERKKKSGFRKEKKIKLFVLNCHLCSVDIFKDSLLWNFIFSPAFFVIVSYYTVSCIRLVLKILIYFILKEIYFKSSNVFKFVNRTNENIPICSGVSSIIKCLLVEQFDIMRRVKPIVMLINLKLFPKKLNLQIIF